MIAAATFESERALRGRRNDKYFRFALEYLVCFAAIAAEYTQIAALLARIHRLPLIQRS